MTRRGMEVVVQSQWMKSWLRFVVFVLGTAIFGAQPFASPCAEEVVSGMSSLGSFAAIRESGGALGIYLERGDEFVAESNPTWQTDPPQLVSAMAVTPSGKQGWFTALNTPEGLQFSFGPELAFSFLLPQGHPVSAMTIYRTPVAEVQNRLLAQPTRSVPTIPEIFAKQKWTLYLIQNQPKKRQGYRVEIHPLPWESLPVEATALSANLIKEITARPGDPFRTHDLYEAALPAIITFDFNPEQTHYLVIDKKRKLAWRILTPETIALPQDPLVLAEANFIQVLSRTEVVLGARLGQVVIANPENGEVLHQISPPQLVSWASVAAARTSGGYEIYAVDELSGALFAWRNHRDLPLVTENFRRETGGPPAESGFRSVSLSEELAPMVLQNPLPILGAAPEPTFSLGDYTQWIEDGSQSYLRRLLLVDRSGKIYAKIPKKQTGILMPSESQEEWIEVKFASGAETQGSRSAN